MCSIHNRDDLEKLEKFAKTRSLLRQQIAKEALRKQDFHYKMEEVFEPFTEHQKQNQIQTKLEVEKQLQPPRDSTQTTTQAIRDQTRATYQRCNALNKNLQKSIEAGIQEYDEMTNRTNQLITDLVIVTKLTLQSLGQFLTSSTTKSKVNPVYILLKEVRIYSQLTLLIFNKYSSKPLR